MSTSSITESQSSAASRCLPIYLCRQVARSLTDAKIYCCVISKRVLGNCLHFVERGLGAFLFVLLKGYDKIDDLFFRVRCCLRLQRDDGVNFSGTVEHLPIGIRNVRYTICWANSLLQMVMHVPLLQQMIEDDHTPELQPVRELIQNYRTEQRERHPIGESVDTMRMQAILFPGEQENLFCPFDAFIKMSRFLEASLPNYSIAVNAIAFEGNQPLPFLEMLTRSDAVGEGNDVHGIPFAKFSEYVTAYRQLPEHFFLHIQRREDRDHEELNQVGVPVEISPQFDYGAQGDALQGTYSCDAFIVYRGVHYFIYEKKPDGTWWLCNDKRRSIIPENVVREEMKKGYFFHLHRIQP